MRFLSCLFTLASLTSLQAFDSPYVGANFGLSQTTGQYKNESIGGGEFNNAGDSRTSMIVDVYAGYGWMIDQFYIGPEFSFTFGNQKITPFDTSESDRNSKTLKITAKRTWSTAVAIRLGYMIKKDVLLFVGLGLSYTPWETKFENVARDQSAVNDQLVVTKKNAAFAVEPSIGLEISLTNSLFTRLSYSCDLPIRVTGNQKIVPVQGFSNYNSDTIHHTLRLMTHTFKIGLGYRF